jgi:hypothetical protein
MGLIIFCILSWELSFSSQDQFQQNQKWLLTGSQSGFTCKWQLTLLQVGKTVIFNKPVPGSATIWKDLVSIFQIKSSEMKLAKSHHLLFICGIVIVITFFSTVSGCKKTISENPFTEVTTLDCRNLLIRKISLQNSMIEITLENSCKNCDDDFLYLGMTMTDRNNVSDTLAQTSCLSCLGCPKNGESKVYQLNTSLTSLPDIKSVQLNFGYLCTDLSYLPK